MLFRSKPPAPGAFWFRKDEVRLDEQRPCLCDRFVDPARNGAHVGRIKKVIFRGAGAVGHSEPDGPQEMTVEVREDRQGS